MSLIHLEKSVLTFHARELLEDGCAGSGLPLLGLGILMFGSRLLPSIAQASRPLAKEFVKSQIAQSAGDRPVRSSGAAPSDRAYRPNVTLTEWVRQAQRQQARPPVTSHRDRVAA